MRNNCSQIIIVRLIPSQKAHPKEEPRHMGKPQENANIPFHLHILLSLDFRVLQLSCSGSNSSSSSPPASLKKSSPYHCPPFSPSQVRKWYCVPEEVFLVCLILGFGRAFPSLLLSLYYSTINLNHMNLHSKCVHCGLYYTGSSF